jgi:MoxR-like ATPase
MNPEQFVAVANNIETEISKVIIGQHDVLRHTLIAVLAGGHVLLEGMPGLGKTSLVRAFGQTLDLRFKRIQFTPDLMPADIVGTDILEDTADGKRAFRFQAGPIFSNLVLADEINRATPKTQSALLEAMQERTVSVLGRTYRVEPPFFVLATQNPIEMEGTYPLPEAQLDRFMFKLNVGFPSADELARIVDDTTSDKNVRASRVANAATLAEMGQFSRAVPASSQITQYAAQVISASHPGHPDAPDIVRRYVRFGSSPRGAQSLLLGGRVLALLNGRYNVSLDDVRFLAPAALRHRILLNYEGQGEGISTDDVVQAVLDVIKIA